MKWNFFVTAHLRKERGRRLGGKKKGKVKVEEFGNKIKDKNEKNYRGEK